MMAMTKEAIYCVECGMALSYAHTANGIVLIHPQGTCDNSMKIFKAPKTFELEEAKVA